MSPNSPWCDGMKMQITTRLAAVAWSVSVVGFGTAQLGAQDAGARAAEPAKQRWEMGLVIKGGDGPSFGVSASAPVPTVWPEQKVEIVDQQVTSNVRRVSYRMIGEGARQMVVTVPRLAAGEEAKAVITFDVTRSAISPPADPGSLSAPKRKTRELLPYLSDSPHIESRHKKIRDTAAEVVAGIEGDWQRTEAIYDFVQEKVVYQEGTLRGALAALEEGLGDCEERTSLFIALCRAEGIPARTVWVPGHCYPEFYLLDGAGQGHWIPCQSAGDRQFGTIVEPRPILQKGDNFKLPEFRERLRYARVTLSISNQKGRIPPTVEHVERMVDAGHSAPE